MPRDLPLGNGRLAVNFDRSYHLTDIYYPNIGKENQTAGRPCHFGAWRGGRFGWVGDEGFLPESMAYQEDTLVTQVSLVSADLGLRLKCQDVVDFNEAVYLRQIDTFSLDGSRGGELRLFFQQDFHLLETTVGDSATYLSHIPAIVHFKDDRYVLRSGLAPSGSFDQFAVGQSEMHGLEGTWRDAEDGELEGNPVAQGAVDATIRFTLKVGERMWYWMAFGESLAEVERLNRMILDKGPEELLRRTRSYWRLWANSRPPDLGTVTDAQIAPLFRRSLLTIATQVDHQGGIIASSDYDLIRYAQDTYNYVWGRDGALVSDSLDQGGHSHLAEKFFSFICPLIQPGGYLGHKYNPDGTPGSTWHASWRDGKPALPIQEDETALVLWALGRMFSRHHQVEVIRPHYRPFIMQAAAFMASHVDPATGLPLPTYDLWEERWGIHAYTIGATVAGLSAGASFARSFGETKEAEAFQEAADKMAAAFYDHFWNDQAGRLARCGLTNADGHLVELDMTADSALLGLSQFDEMDHPRLRQTWRELRQVLSVQPSDGGIARYVNDQYQTALPNSQEIPGNPWFIATLWAARTLIREAEDPAALAEAQALISWCASHALPSGIMAEQVHPLTHEPLSVSPLTWSHSAFVSTVLALAKKGAELGGAPH